MITDRETVSSICYTHFSNMDNESAQQTVMRILQTAFDMNDTQARHFLDVSQIDAPKMKSIFYSVQTSEIEQVVEQIEVREQSHILIGCRIASGYYGVVYAHWGDESRVIKRIKRVGYTPGSSHSIDNSHRLGSFPLSSSQHVENNLVVEERLQSAIEEARLFCRYYGCGTARVIVAADEVYIEMKKIPGQPINDIGYGGFQPDAVERFWDMLFRLDHLGIWHNDISLCNILYDKDANTFYPIDISNLMNFPHSVELSTDVFEDATRNILSDIECIIDYIQKKSP